MKSASTKFQILLFLACTFAFSFLQHYFIIKKGGIGNNSNIFLLMWTPGIFGLLFSWLFGWRFNDIGFTRGQLRYYVLAYAIPALTALLILFVLVGTGLGSFEINPQLIEKKGSLTKALLTVLLMAPTVGIALPFISALGEEIGWRGFLHSKLIRLKLPHPFLLTGIIWAIWHWPLILFSNYATSETPLLSMTLFTINVISFSVFMGWLRQKSGSVLTPALAHAVHNMWIQGIYPAFLKKGPYDQYWGGESGVLNTLFYLILALILYRRFNLSAASHSLYDDKSHNHL